MEYLKRLSDGNDYQHRHKSLPVAPAHTLLEIHIESGVYFFTKIVIHLHVYVLVYGGSKVE
jgi:hypothetical protein